MPKRCASGYTHRTVISTNFSFYFYLFAQVVRVCSQVQSIPDFSKGRDTGNVFDPLVSRAIRLSEGGYFDLGAFGQVVGNKK